MFSPLSPELYEESRRAKTKVRVIRWADKDTKMTTMSRRG